MCNTEGMKTYNPKDKCFTGFICKEGISELNYLQYPCPQGFYCPEGSKDESD
jgi:hypothetical protein